MLLRELLSRFAFLPPRENIVFPNKCTLSGLSNRDAILPAFDLPDEWRDRLRLFVELEAIELESRERKEDAADEMV